MSSSLKNIAHASICATDYGYIKTWELGQRKYSTRNIWSKLCQYTVVLNWITSWETSIQFVASHSIENKQTVTYTHNILKLTKQISTPEPLFCCYTRLHNCILFRLIETNNCTMSIMRTILSISIKFFDYTKSLDCSLHNKTNIIAFYRPKTQTDKNVRYKFIHPYSAYCQYYNTNFESFIRRNIQLAM